MRYDDEGIKQYLAEHGVNSVRHEIIHNAGINTRGPLRACLIQFFAKIDSGSAGTPASDILDYKLLLLDEKLSVLLEKWKMFKLTNSPLEIQTSNGKVIRYSGVKFDGSPAIVFQEYFPPFIRDGLFTIIHECAEIYKAKNISRVEAEREILARIEIFLDRFYKKLAVVHGSINSYDRQIEVLKAFAKKQTRAKFYIRHSFRNILKWIVGVLLGAAGISLVINMYSNNISGNRNRIIQGTNVNITGPVYQGDITALTQVVTANPPVAKIKIKRAYEDFLASVEDLKKAYYKELKSLESNFASRNTLRNGVFIQTQKDLIFETRKKINGLFQKFDRTIQDILIEHTQASSFQAAGDEFDNESMFLINAKERFDEFVNQLDGALRDLERTSNKKN